MVKKKNLIKNIILVITVLLLMGLIVYLVGRSYGFFRYTKEGETTNVITIKGIRVEVIEDNGALNLENTEPLYDSDGMQLRAFTFTITNTSKRPLDYAIKVVNDTDKQSECLINEGEANEATCPVLTTDYIKYSYSLNNGTYSEPENLGANNDVITTYTINGEETLRYSIKMWIKSDATNEIQNHYFFGQLIIQGTAGTAEMYRPYDVATILSNFNSEDLKEVVACSNDNKYQDCEIYNTIEEAIADKTKSLIIVTKDLEKTGSIEYTANKDITLEMNGYSINKTTGTGALFYGAGKLDIRNSSQTRSELRGLGTVINPRTDSELVVSNIDVISENTDNASTICTAGKVTINSGTHIEGPHGIGCHTANGSITIINGGEIIGTTRNALSMNAGYDAKLIINDGYFEGYNTAVGISDRDEVEIYGGTFIGKNSSAISNNSSKIVKIVQTDKPIYIASTAQTWNPAIKNISVGILNISGNQADQCTNISTNTTSGLCVYAEGTKTYANDTSNSAIMNSYNGENTSSQAIVNIDGGTYYGGHIGIANQYSGTVNIKNANISSGNKAIRNLRPGTINICNSNTNGGITDLENTVTGTLNYNNVTFSNGTTTPDSGKTIGTITESATCPISE